MFLLLPKCAMLIRIGMIVPSALAASICKVAKRPVTDLTGKTQSSCPSSVYSELIKWFLEANKLPKRGWGRTTMIPSWTMEKWTCRSLWWPVVWWSFSSWGLYRGWQWGLPPSSKVGGAGSCVLSFYHTIWGSRKWSLIQEHCLHSWTCLFPGGPDTLPLSFCQRRSTQASFQDYPTCMFSLQVVANQYYGHLQPIAEQHS